MTESKPSERFEIDNEGHTLSELLEKQTNVALPVEIAERLDNSLVNLLNSEDSSMVREAGEHLDSIASALLLESDARSIQVVDAMKVFFEARSDELHGDWIKERHDAVASPVDPEGLSGLIASKIGDNIKRYKGLRGEHAYEKALSGYDRAIKMCPDIFLFHSQRLMVHAKLVNQDQLAKELDQLEKDFGSNEQVQAILRSFKDFRQNHRENRNQCFIATAVYDVEHQDRIDSLRKFRDQVLARHATGRSIICGYYRLSPPLAGWLRGRVRLRLILRAAVLDPVVVIIRRFWV